MSVVMIFLDGERFIDEAIRSVVEQREFDDWELILVDDGSTDTSSTIARAWAETDADRIRYVRHPGHANRGMSASRNLGVATATGRFVTFLDCDDVWLPTALAHRMRVARSNPAAELVIGGTWRWHSWTGEPADVADDVPMSLPQAPHLRLIRPPDLYPAIYGFGGQVPAMCSIVVDRAALLRIGGFDGEFRGMYEDQVLYAKAGLELTAIIDPRPLALYRQHPASTCAVSASTGEWTPTGTGPAADRFALWLEQHAERHVEPGSPAWRAMHPEAAPPRQRPTIRGGLSSARRRARRHLPAPLRRAIALVRSRVRHPDDEARSIVGRWSAQFLSVSTAAATGRVLVVGTEGRSSEPWVGRVPRSAFGATEQVTHAALADVAPGERFHHVVVPVGGWAGGLDALWTAIAGVLAPGGTVTVMVPGPAHPAHVARSDGRSAPSSFVIEVEGLRASAEPRFPGMRVSVESFGSPATVRALAQGPSADTGAELGVAIDQHDPRTPVVLAITIEPSLSPPVGAAARHDVETFQP